MNPFSRMHRLSLFICARTYSAGLFTSPPTGAVCQRRLWMQKTMGRGGASKLFIMKTERQGRLGVAPPSAPSILQTNVRIAWPQRSNHPARRRVENRLEWKKAVRLSSF